VFSPAFGDKVEERVDIRECETSGAFLVGHRWEEAFGVVCGVAEQLCV
jgi:hypothetical protein